MRCGQCSESVFCSSYPPSTVKMSSVSGVSEKNNNKAESSSKSLVFYVFSGNPSIMTKKLNGDNYLNWSVLSMEG